MPGITTKLALRNLRKNKAFTLLNILGLTLGLSTFILIVLYVADELSFDRFNVNADRIYRIQTDLVNNGKTTSFADASPAVTPIVKANFPEVEAVARLFPEEGCRFRQGDQDIYEHETANADPDFFRIFTLHPIEGDPFRATQQPNTAVLTASAAQRYFHSTKNIIGKTMTRLDVKTIYTVVAVIEDLPSQSSFKYDIFLSTRGNDVEHSNSLYALYPMSTFAMLKPGASRAAFDKNLGQLMGRFDKDYNGMVKETNGSWNFLLGEMPLTAIHLHSHRTDELGNNSDIQYVYIFSAIAIFVILIAGINFMNLSTARSANRAREVGVRKVLGSGRGQLIGQFLSESFLITIAAALIAVTITVIALPAFNHLTGKEMTLSLTTLRWLIPTIIGIIAVVGVFSGAYPAFFLSGFRPVQVLKGKLALNGKAGSLRNILVVLQFSISIFLIVGTLVVYRQLNFIQHRDPGYDRSQLLVLKDLDGMSHPEAFKKQVRSVPGVTNASLTAFLPTGGHRWHNWGTVVGQQALALETQLWIVDEDYIPTMGMHIAKGRNFSPDMPTDSSGIVLNETAARMFGIGEDPLNKTIHYQAYLHHPTNFTVIGVVKDFNFTSVRTSVAPLVLVNREADDEGGLSIRIAAGHVPDALTKVKAAWASYAPQKPFTWSFMDEDFDAIYRAEQRMGNVVVVLTTLAILIACLGLFGLAAFAAEQRAKEISIRKVLGANISSIVALLSKDFGRLIILAVLIASPLAWLVMHRWLDNFAYRTTISVWLFPLAAGIILVVAAVTTLFQSLKAAVANPVETLRNE